MAVTATNLVMGIIAVTFWHQLSADQKHTLLVILKQESFYFFMALILLFVAFGFTLDWFFRFYIIPINQLADETELIYSVNPELKIQIDASHDVMRLAEVINRSAEQQASFRRSVEKQLQLARSETKTEKDILATLLENLPQGILVCNTDGGIVFFNKKIRDLLTHHAAKDSLEQPDTNQWFSLGRSVYAFVDRTLIERALDRIGHKLSEGQPVANERFLVGMQSKSMLPAQLIPVLSSQHHITGYIIYIDDQLARRDKEKQISIQLQKWRHQLTQSISVIKAIAEIVKNTSFRTDGERDHLIRILADESNLAARFMTQQDVLAKWAPNQPWPLTAFDAAEWANILAQRITEKTGLAFQLNTQDVKAQISIDIHHLTTAMVFVVSKLREALEIDHAQGNLMLMASWVYLDIVWQGKGLEASSLNLWKNESPVANGSAVSIILEEILESHGAKLWISNYHLPQGCAGLRLLLPTVEASEMVYTDGYVTVLPDSRPEFYDFDLFQQAGQTPELDKRLLAELTYTAFDTETTGLDPQGGDEIISIGAVRIVNGRLLTEDTFDQLVDPRRSLPWASVKFHGIRPEMLVDQPVLEEVLPRFQKFAQETILIGHNVAFDMRMLQLKEDQCNIRFINPVLDTMLLSAVVHPAHATHSLNAIAERLGVPVIGRHTALGDAITTAEIFLKLIPLLANKSIRTLQQARQASEKTFYARLKY